MGGEPEREAGRLRTKEAELFSLISKSQWQCKSSQYLESMNIVLVYSSCESDFTIIHSFKHPELITTHPQAHNNVLDGRLAHLSCLVARKVMRTWL